MSAPRRRAGARLIEREEPFVADWSLDTPPEAAIVAAAAAACAAAGLDGTPAGVTYGSDASKLWALAGVPSIVFGPGDIAQAHTADEWVSLQQLTDYTTSIVRILSPR